LLHLELVGLAIDFGEQSTFNPVCARNLNSKELIATILFNFLNDTWDAVRLGNNFGTESEHETS
jgi:hypothetical protein